MSPPLTVYEHTAIYRDEHLTPTQLKALQAFHGTGEDFPYYRLIHNGIRFRSYVGVLRVGDLTIEVLPKADNNGEDENYWRHRLFDMLRVVHDLPLRSPSAASLRTRPHDVLHLYLQLLLEYAETLHRRGLHRAYHAERTNATALSGRLLIAEQLRYNLVHKERFFVARDRFDFDTPLNRILGQALRVATRLNGLPRLRPRFQSLCEAWPELPDMPITAATFDRLRFPRGTEAYRPAMAIARLILLRHAPTTRGGRDLPALMFNMNRLWEVFLERVLRRELPDHHVSGQESTAYYHPEKGTSSVIKPDISVRNEAEELVAILDAKWKVPGDLRPSSTDLQQMYTYVHHLEAEQVALLYPGAKVARPQVPGWFGREQSGGKRCTVIGVPLPNGSDGSSAWMQAIGTSVRNLLNQDAVGDNEKASTSSWSNLE